MIPVIKAPPSIKIPADRLPVAIVLPNYEQFSRAFPEASRLYVSEKMRLIDSQIRAKLKGNLCFVIPVDNAYADGSMVLEIFLRPRRQAGLNFLARSCKIDGSISRYQRVPGRLNRIGYNSLGGFEALYSIDDFETKAIMLTDVFLDRTKYIRKGFAAKGGKPAAKKSPGKKGR